MTDSAGAPEPSHSSTQKPGYSLGSRIPELDGIRGLAILLILIWHYLGSTVHPHGSPDWLVAVSRSLGFAWNGVDLFFVLSGFLIGGILLDHRESPSLFRTFYIRRFMRIVPLYAVFVGVYFLLAYSPVGPRFPWLFDHPLPGWSYLTYTQNMTAWWEDRFGPNWLGITWSLAIEEQFYVLLPFLIWVLPVRFFPAVCVVAILSAFPLRLMTQVAMPEHKLAAVFPIWCRWDSLFCGVLLAWMRRQSWWEATGSREGLSLGWLIFLSTLAWMLGLTYFGRTDPIDFHMLSYGLTGISLCYASLLFLVLHGTVLKRLVAGRFLVFFGTVSYGLYIFHQAILGLAHGLVFGDEPRLETWDHGLVTVAALVLTIVLSRMSYECLEVPLIRWGHQWKYDSGKTKS